MSERSNWASRVRLAEAGRTARIRRWLWKWLWCSWAHRKHRCYPEVWGRGLDGPWHCALCHPCGEALDEAIARALRRHGGVTPG